MTDVYLDISKSGRVMAHVLEPPGLGIRFPSRDAMESGFTPVLADHLAWLSAHGEPVPPDASYRIAEEVEVAGDFESGDDAGFYGPDTLPVTRNEIERYLRIGSWAHRELLELVDPLPEELLERRESPSVRSIREILLHVAQAELWYMTRILDDPTDSGLPAVISQAHGWVKGHSARPLDCLRVSWEAFQEFARSLPPGWEGRVTVPGWYASIPEKWSARKMLRRAIEHCREHTRNIRRLLMSWEINGPRPPDDSPPGRRNQA